MTPTSKVEHRLGTNFNPICRPDPSAVQKCIRTRIAAARDDEIRSIYDLGMIIIDQCSRVFFDRTQSIDMQPQVMDSFGNAIGKVVCPFTKSHVFQFPKKIYRVTKLR